MKCTIKKSCDLGKIIDDYYETQETEFFGSEIEVAITFPWDRCFEDNGVDKEKPVLQKCKTDNKETIEVLKSAVGKMIEELWSSIEGLGD